MNTFETETAPLPSATKSAILSGQYGLQHINPDMSDTRIWREFSSGMSMLPQQIRRTSANINTIARTNLKLLHSDFLSDKKYQLYTAKKSANKPNQRWLPIAKRNGIQCGILNLSHKQALTMDFDLSGEPPINEQLQLADAKNEHHNGTCLVMFYVIQGKLSIQLKNTDQDTLSKIEILKAGDATTITTDQQMECLRSNSDNSQVLIVAISTH